MNTFFQIVESDGVFTTILPPFDQSLWPAITPLSTFIWVERPTLDISDGIEAIVAEALFGTKHLDVKCSIHRLDIDVSISAVKFLEIVASTFPQGLDFICSEKHQPAGFNLSSINKSKWPVVMTNNRILFTFHRPAGGERSLVTSPKRDTIVALLERFRSG